MIFLINPFCFGKGSLYSDYPIFIPCFNLIYQAHGLSDRVGNFNLLFITQNLDLVVLTRLSFPSYIFVFSFMLPKITPKSVSVSTIQVSAHSSRIFIKKIFNASNFRLFHNQRKFLTWSTDM